MSKEHRRELTEVEKEKVLKEFEEKLRKYYANRMSREAIVASMEEEPKVDDISML